jgi:hypothetical protein
MAISIVTPARRSFVRIVAAVPLAGAIVSSCAGAPAATPVARDPDAVTIDNGSGLGLAIEYEYPDGATEPVVDVEPGETAVVRSIFEGREGLCRVGRLVASDAEGREVAELYNVCRSRLWTIEAP